MTQISGPGTSFDLYNPESSSGMGMDSIFKIALSGLFEGEEIKDIIIDGKRDSILEDIDTFLDEMEEKESFSIIEMDDKALHFIKKEDDYFYDNITKKRKNKEGLKIFLLKNI